MRKTSVRRRTRLVALAGAGAVLAPLAVGAPTWATPSVNAVDEAGTYIVMLKDDAVATYEGGIKGIPATKPAQGDKLDADSAAAQSYTDHLVAAQDEVLASVGKDGSDKIYEYTVALNGFAVDLTTREVQALRKNPDVLFMWEDELRHADTVTTPDYLGMRGEGGVWDTQFGGPADAGTGIVVGVIDSGIWPENPSFADLPGTPAPPEGWTGECEAGEEPDPEGNVTCNSKLIGARYYAAGNNTEYDFMSPRDTNGHGSHTAGTSAGNNAVDMTVYETPMGDGSGMAPAAHIAAYKALWQTADGTGSGMTSGLVMAINDAVEDGVDVINYSVSGSTQLVVDSVEMAFLNAADAGVFVAASAGNSGDTNGPGSVAHNSPWLMTVAASTHNRDVSKYVELGDGTTYDGVGVGPEVGPAPLVDSEDIPAADSTAADARLCLPDSIDPAEADGHIVICTRGTNDRVEKSATVAEAGGVGMILANTSNDQSLNADFHAVPSIHVNATAGDAIKAYEDSATDPTAYISALGEGSGVGVVPEMAGFSSYGPAVAGGGDLLKPDITAPGVDVIAAVSPAGDPGTMFNSMSGTSMSAPHVAGLAALMMDKNEGWSPMAVKSSMMTTADPTNSEGEPIHYAGEPASPLHYGSGEVEPAAAYDTPLVYESDKADWYAYACSIGQLQLLGGGQEVCDSLPEIDPSDLNYPSIAIGQLAGAQTVTRTVTATGEGGTFIASVEAPEGMTVTVSPESINVPAGGSAEFEVTITNVSAPVDEWAFGSVTWSGPGADVRSPIAVQPVAVAAPNELVVSAGDIVDRIAGTDRYATAAEIAMNYPDDVDTVYIATGDQFADALAGAAPAAKGLVPGGDENGALVAPDGSPAPVLLTRSDLLPSATRGALETLSPSRIVILGGEGAVSGPVEDELEAYGTVTRIAGEDRYDTAAKLAMEYGTVERVYVATGEGFNFPDALSGGALAGHEGLPVLLVKGDRVPSTVTAALEALGDPEVTVLGGPRAVSDTVAQELGSTDRLAGTDRYDTAVKVAERFGYSSDNPAPVVHVADGTNYPDALAGSALAGWQGVPLMLSKPEEVPASTMSAMVAIAPQQIFLLGGVSALSTEVETEIEATFNGETSRSFEVVPGTTGTMTSVVHGLVPAASQEVSVTSDGPSGGGSFADAIIPVTIPAGAAAYRVEVWQDEWTAPSGPDLDLDLYLATSAGQVIAQSAAGGSDESITLMAPEPGEYLVAIDHWNGAEGDVATGPLHTYAPTGDEGNLEVTPSPVPVVIGEPVTLTATWTGLEAATRYLGVIGYDFGAGEQGRTLVTVVP